MGGYEPSGLVLVEEQRNEDGVHWRACWWLSAWGVVPISSSPSTSGAAATEIQLD